MRQKSTLQKGTCNSDLCVVVGSKFRANFLIMRHCPRAYVHIYVHAHCLLAIAASATGVINCLGYSKWLQLQVMLYIRSSAAYAVIMCNIGSGIQSSAKCWEQLAGGRMNAIITLWLSWKKELVVWSDTCLV